MAARAEEETGPVQIPDHGCSDPSWWGAAITAVAGAVSSVVSYRKGRLGRIGHLETRIKELEDERSEEKLVKLVEGVSERVIRNMFGMNH